MRYSVISRTTSAALSLVLTVTGSLVFAPQTSQAAGGLALDKLVSAHQTTQATTVTAPTFNTAAAGELLVAFLSTDGPSGSKQTFSAVTGGGLTWRLRQRTNTQPGTAEVWQAVAPAVLTGVSVKATHSGSYQATITVAAFTGASTSTDGAVATASAANGAPSATLTTTRAGSWVWGVGNDWDNAVARTVGPGQTKVDEYLTPTGDTLWTQRQNAVTAATGAAVTLNDTAPTADRWNLAAIEIPAATVPPADTTPPSVPTGVIAQPTSANRVDVSWQPSTDDTAVTGYQVLRDGAQIAAVAGTTYADTSVAPVTSYGYSVRAVDGAGNTSAASTTATVTTPTAPPPGTAPSLDPSTPGPNAVLNNVLTTTSLSFSPPAQTVVYAVFSMDSSAYGNLTTVASVTNTGTPLVWHLLGRENHRDDISVGGFVEVWWAYNATAQSGITATTTFSQPTKNVPAPVGDFQILVVKDAAADQSTAAYGINWSYARTNTLSATVTTTAPNSRVFAAFDNWDSSATVTPGPDQVIQSLILNPADVDEYWVQSKTTPIATPATIQMTATIPDTNPWHALAWEILAK